MQLVRQQTLYHEEVTKNGITKKVHYIVKNCPFELTIGLATNPANPNKTYNFKNSRLEASLLYDLPTKNEITLVSSKPMSYEIVSNRGDECSVQIRLLVLSNHYEKCNFLIRFRLFYGVEGHEFYELVSEPLKCVSKQAQVKKKIAQQNGTVTATRNNTRRKKRTRSEIDLDNNLSQIMSKLDQHSSVLAQIVNLQTMGNSTSANYSQVFAPLYTSNHQESYVCDPKEQFEQAFLEMLDAYENYRNTGFDQGLIPDNVQPSAKRRKLIENPEIASHPAIAALTKELDDEFGVVDNGKSTVCGGENCPYKVDLEQINSMYMEMLLNDPVMTM
eukprot:TRINITY_DN2194_c0_g1_i1.p1 TRINITY_DN2194_c0_g1~~TRINITY_DN2194_c0_g1_i1.p1  ORF type:complete len:347 (-),score=44.95 TRINITY_DN2194_c0_g1_i1:32-1024(-)